MAIDPNKYASTADFSGFLEPEKAAPIFEEMTRKSLVQPLARKIPMGPTGVSVPFWDGDVQASWVDEGGKKPLTKGGFDKFTVKPEKIAAIFAMSSEVVRANPENYINVMRQKVAEAFAKAFDDAALHGTNTPFGDYIDQTTKTVSLGKDAFSATNNALSLLVEDGKKWTGGLLDARTEPIINGSVDANNRPLFIEPTYTETNSLTRTGRILSRPVTIAEGVAAGDSEAQTLGYYGDFSKVIWGQIGGISYDVTDQATLDLSAEQDGSGLTSLWQHNLVAVRCEAEFALRVHDKDAFVKVTA
ncbi:phage major capsid protein [uncultured Corynebacterium sp.]|uniref:phage major capsid protein n=1 Tax=uncultured Corynebacterium sp. TaxID=159447 RepID=UPI00260ED751|nr:phage major capsid protein [uncultured Corynebacterium sp.]